MEINAEESAFEKAHIPEGIHNAELVDIKDTSDGQYGPRVILDFEIYYSKNEGPAKIGRFLGKKLTPKAKLWEAFVSLGGKPEVGKPFSTDDLLGNPCRVMVEDYEDNDGKTVTGITKVKAPDESTVEYIAEAKQKLQKIKEGDNAKAEEEEVKE